MRALAGGRRRRGVRERGQGLVVRRTAAGAWGGSNGNGRKGRCESTRALAARVRGGRRHGIRPRCNVAEDKRRRGRSVARDKAQKRITQARRGGAETGGVN